MASQGPRYPGSAASSAGSAGENANAWLNPTNISADDGTESQITAATYDSPDISELLFASNFGFTIPAGSTIDGITVEIDRRSIIASSGKDFRVQVFQQFEGLVGTNKAVPATIWPTTSTVATYGGAADTWGITPLGAWAGNLLGFINSADFQVVLACQANIANADIAVDYIRVTVHYTEVVPEFKVGSDSATVADIVTYTVTMTGDDASVSDEVSAMTAALILSESAVGDDVAEVLTPPEAGGKTHVIVAGV